MRLLVLSLIVCLLITDMTAQTLNVMTFNLRLNTLSDSANAWPYRRNHVASVIQFNEADILGVQEALYDQMLDLQQRLPGYAWHGAGRDDGKTKGEFSAIFYNSSRLEKLDGSTFWLSQTPSVPGSKSWDAAITRIVSWMKMKDKKTGKIFFVFNTHFDHMGQEARRQSAHILLQAVDSIAGKVPAIITGDFNATPEDEPVRILTNASEPLHFTDSKSVSQSAHFGPTGTFNGFGSKETSDLPIDHIFLRGNFVVLKHATLSETWGGRFASDHFPVFSRLLIQ